MKVHPMHVFHLVLTASALVLQACASHPSAIDDHFGLALRSAVQAQTVNLEPIEAPGKIGRSDGQSAKSAIDRYQRSFDAIPPTTNVYNIGVGSGAGTSQ